MAVVAVLAALTVLAGCGGDDEPSDTAAKPAPKTDTAAKTDAGKLPPAPKTDTAVPQSTPKTSPEQTTPGGPGDENPARSQALLTGRGGRIAPAVVRVPPFISIRVELRSADGRSYALRFGRRRLSAGGQVSSASASFPGLRPGKALVGRPVGGTGNAVRVEANAEPGP
jgi:hypothetical protein